MKDAKNDRQNNQPAFNPFRALRKKDFPQGSSRQGQAPVSGKKHAGKTPVTSEEEDAALFLASVAGTDLHDVRRKKGDAEDAEIWNSFARTMQTAQDKKDGSTSPATPDKLPKAAPANPLPRQETQPAGHEKTDELAFAEAMRNVTPLTGKGRDIPQEPDQNPGSPSEGRNPLQDFIEGKLEFALSNTNEYVEGHVVGLDLATVGKLQSGSLSPEACLDLHGLNAQQAFQRLVGFMRNAYLRTQRTVLIVTGRGLNSPNGIPVLRYEVQTWLTQEPLRRVTLAFCTALPCDGGAGALYVLLRKFRKKLGKVHWDRTPLDPDLLP